MNDNDIMNGVKIASSGVFVDDSDIMSDCLWALNYIADTDDEALLESLASSEIMPRVISCIGDKEHKVFVPSLRCLGNILTSDDSQIVEKAIFLGALKQMSAILYSSNSGLIKECCWALSNICAGPPDHISLLVNDPIFDRCMYLA